MSPEIKPIHLWPIDLQQGCHDHRIGKNHLQLMVLQQLDSHTQMDKVGSFIPPIKINSKWVKGLNLKAETIKFLGENMAGGSNLHDLGSGNSFLNMTPKAEATKG